MVLPSDGLPASFPMQARPGPALDTMSLPPFVCVSLLLYLFLELIVQVCDVCVLSLLFFSSPLAGFEERASICLTL